MNKFSLKIIKNILVLKNLFLGKIWRDNDLVTVVSAHNNFSGNCKYAVMVIKQHFPNKKIVWFVENEQQEQNLKSVVDVDTGIRLSLKYIKTIAFSRYILTDGNFMGHWLANGAEQIDFWHGMPIKKIRYDDINKEPSFLRKILWWFNSNNFIQSGSSESNVKILCQSGRLPFKMAKVLGTPCIVPLVDEKILNDEVSKNIGLNNLRHENKNFKKIFLYAPTYRDSGVDFLQNLDFDIEKIHRICEKKNIMFLIKMHPLCNLELDKEYSHIKILDKSYDATLCIGLSDVVITDYSSMYYNAMAGNKEIIIMNGDIEEYRKNNRDIYDESLNDVQGHKINNFNDLCDVIENEIKIKSVPQEIVNKYWDKEILDNPYKFLEVFK